MQLELSDDDVRFLSAQLEERVNHLEAELVHTEKRAFRHELSTDIDRLKAIHLRVKQLLG
jgi:hypothetical protein